MMNPIIKSLLTVTEWLEEKGIAYMVFGGIANSLYGNPRQTFDIDIKITLKPTNPIGWFLEELGKVGEIVPDNPSDFVKETNVIPVDIHGVRVDLVLTQLPFEEEAIGRSRTTECFGARIRVCTPEDLIIQKAVSIREKDWSDIRFIVENLGDEMDWDYLLKHCRELSEFLNDPEIYGRVKRWKNEK